MYIVILTDAMTVCLSSAFLLNTHSYQHLAVLDHTFIPGKVLTQDFFSVSMFLMVNVSFTLQVANRLAVAALSMKEDRDARKAIREVFGAGNGECSMLCTLHMYCSLLNLGPNFFSTIIMYCFSSTLLSSLSLTPFPSPSLLLMTCSSECLLHTSDDWLRD